MGFLVNVSYAQLNPDFTSDITSGCNLIVVEFTDLSSGNPTSWTWDFGNGNTSNLKNPKASFTSTGYYDIKLTISDGTNSKSIIKKNYIRVLKNPTAEFNVSGAKKGCLPFNVDFKDLSVIGDANITQWLWDFGDGATSGLQNPGYTYNLPGTYSISLQVKDASGCLDTKFKNAFVEVWDSPNPAFSAPLREFCSYPATVSFNNASIGTPDLTYTWKFGDDSSSTDKTPQHTYTASGNYTVRLIVSDGNGCVDSLDRADYVKINNVKAKFKIPNDTLCFGAFVAFDNQSTGCTRYEWTFGDGNSATIENPKYMYNNPGWYHVKLKVYDDINCVDSAVKNLYIEEVTAKFGWTPNYSCKLPFDVNFYDSSKNVSLWYWTFGDGDTSVAKNPLHTYTQEGIYDVTLVASSAAGCRDTFSRDSAVEIQLPVAFIVADSLSGCSPLAIDFKDSVLSSEPIVKRWWIFGDGDTSVNTAPVHTYVEDSVYMAYLIIENSAGCTDTAQIKIKVGLKPVIDFEVEKDIACAYDSLKFTDKSYNPSSNPNDEWFWTFGDKATGSGNETTHQHVDTGWMNVQLVVGYNGCYDTLQKDSFHYINAPVSIVEPLFDCDDPFTIMFEQIINKGVDRWEIYFGDLKFELNVPGDTISHIYSKAGSYDYNTIAYNNSTGCFWKNNGNVKVGRINPQFQTDKENYCTGDVAKIIISSDTLGVLKSQRFDFGDHTSSAQGKHRYTSPGTFKITRYTLDVNGCYDSSYRYINVYYITALFTTDTLACKSVSSKFIDQSVSDTAIVSWEWDFGDGQTSSQQNPIHKYQFDGAYSPLLWVENAIGCRNSESKTDYVKVGSPLADFEAEDRYLCQNEDLILINNSSGNQLTFKWYFGDGDSSDQAYPQHLYAKDGLFDVMLVAEDLYGCRDTMLLDDYVDVQAIPNAGFYADTTYSVCYPLLVKFYDTSQSNAITEWYWNFGDQSASTFQNPVHNYTKPGDYDVSLSVTTSYGCKDSVSFVKYISVKGPSAILSLTPDSICLGEYADFSLTKFENVDGFDWDFGDGILEEGSSGLISHQYNVPGLLFPRIVYIDSSGQCRKYDVDTIFVSSVDAGFTVNDSDNFVPMKVEFTDNSSQNAEGWYWTFGDGSDTFSQDASHYYDMVGVYEASLYVKNDFGCLDTARKLIIVNARPVLIDLPSVFTPDKDDNNVIKVEGLGSRFKEMLEFKIFNRWGEMVFETTNADEGWDGNYKGNPQNIDTYVYIVKVLTYEDEIVSQKGYITLLR